MTGPTTELIPERELAQLRHDLQERLEREDQDPAHRASANGLKQLFNSIAPTSQTLSARPGSLQLRTGVDRMTARQVSHISQALSQAVAALTREIPEASPMSQLTQSDYRRAPIFVEAHGGNLLVFQPDERDHVGTLDANLETPASRALARLTDLLPESRQDAEGSVVRAAVAAGPRDRYALSRIAGAASQVAGVSLTWGDDDGTSHGELSKAQAEELKHVLREVNVVEKRRTVRGLLDGTRVGRRRFWIQQEDGTEIGGIVEEEAMTDVLALINREVVADVLEVRAAERSGKEARPIFRLLGLKLLEEPPLPSGV